LSVLWIQAPFLYRSLCFLTVHFLFHGSSLRLLLNSSLL
jgi:hypothetical protein